MPCCADATNNKKKAPYLRNPALPDELSYGLIIAQLFRDVNNVSLFINKEQTLDVVGFAKLIAKLRFHL